jgi:hypothetical protein
MRPLAPGANPLPSRPLLCSARPASRNSRHPASAGKWAAFRRRDRRLLARLLWDFCATVRHRDAPESRSAAPAPNRGGGIVSVPCGLQPSPWALLGRCSVARSRGQARGGAPDACCRQPPPPARLPACRPQHLVQWATHFLATRWRAAAMWGASRQSQRASSGGGGWPPIACARCKRTGPSSRCGLPGPWACLSACCDPIPIALAGSWISSS